MNTLTPSRSSQEITKPRRIGVLIYPGCDVLDVCGPCEAFHWADVWLPRFGKTDEPGYQCHIIAATPGLVRTISGIEVAATHSYTDIGDGLDTLIVTGGVISGEQACKDPALVEWVRSMAPRVRRVASVCTGAFILAAAGLLNHRRVTTHWMFSNVLATEYPSIRVDSSLLFARDGNIYSSGGITAGIDLALALVEEDLGREVALAAARMMVVFPHRPGGQSQFSAYNVKYLEVRSRPEIEELQAWIQGHPAENLSVQALADRMGMSPRNFAQLFQSETGNTPTLFAERARADAARCKLEQTVVPVETIAEECGFGNAERMRRTFQRLLDVSPHDYRARFRSTLLNDRVLATVLLTDIIGSTERAAALGDQMWKELMAVHNDQIRKELAHYRGREIRTTGDGFQATFDAPGRAICCAHAICQSAHSLGLEIRTGLHTGELELMENDDLAGIAAHIAARVAALAGPNEVLVSGTVKDLVVGSGIEFIDRGSHVLKGVPGERQLYSAVRTSASTIPARRRRARA